MGKETSLRRAASGTTCMLLGLLLLMSPALDVLRSSGSEMLRSCRDSFLTGTTLVEGERESAGEREFRLISVP